MDQFKNIQNGSTVYWLDKNALVTGSAIVKSVTAPHIQTIPTVSSSLVIDVTLSNDGVDKLYTMPDRACIAYARAVSKDSDGYDGMIFKRWLTDCGGRGIQINWDLFI